ncbi:MAG: L-2-hydroxyglutarate oxidase [Candidatus Omnitrophica bacterium]|nr:L-2-hydroxyglutarate oxidase [Candidatus Omnitrophota bacterium]MDE2009696.1 L-2-hydroxyglutarate oxidase [Candidatus Omnitrophota bacterium]MDE2231834.1 L-2-hydroxyglutarate oxidase [Candidatus Omnitrophota bacterium]
MKKYDFIIIGSGIIGLGVALALKDRKEQSRILVMDKEAAEAQHASGRNSGVLHAGFYYTADSLKARFTVEGSRAMKAYVKSRGLKINECGKLVVAQNEHELGQLDELLQRGKHNGSNVRLVDEAEACRIEPNVRTFKRALYSPDTASIDPKEVCASLKNDLQRSGVEFSFDTKYLGRSSNILQTTKGDFEAGKIINAAGLYADRVARDFGFGFKYTMVPFKGLYLKYTSNKTDVTTNIYPVPNLKNPFLGVHYTKTVTGDIKIGPTAIPAFWRENYGAASGFSAQEMAEVLFFESKLYLTNAFNFRSLAHEEMRKYNKEYFISLAASMVRHIDPQGFTEWTKPGIRAQLLDKQELKLVQDFVVEGDHKSIHVLNAVSPAFTCAFPFARYVVDQYVI